MMGRLHAYIFFQERYMLNEVGVKIKLVRSKDAFCLMGGVACKVNILRIHVRSKGETDALRFSGSRQDSGTWYGEISHTTRGV